MTTITVDLKIKERKGKREYTIDKIKGMKIEQAINLLKYKYVSSTKQKPVMKILDDMYNEIKKEFDNKYG